MVVAMMRTAGSVRLSRAENPSWLKTSLTMAPKSIMPRTIATTISRKWRMKLCHEVRCAVLSAMTGSYSGAPAILGEVGRGGKHLIGRLNGRGIWRPGFR
jgi:hypothetical protein